MNPFTNFPTAYANRRAELITPICVASSVPLSRIGFFMTLSDVLHT